MNNEVMARAITKIDDDIIADNYDNIIPFHKRKAQVRAALAAACVALIVLSSAIFALRQTEPKIYAYGSLVEDKPITVASSSNGELKGRGIKDGGISITMKIKSGGNVKLEADGGELDVCNTESGELLYSGKLYETKTPVSVTWIVKNPGTEHVYTLSLNDGKTVIGLVYDNENNNWTIQKQ